jgi:hypothetical protein
MVEGFSQAGIKSEYKILEVDQNGAKLDILG